MTREKLLNQIAAYIPYNEQEAADRELILHWIRDHDDAFTRQNKVAHITASAWVVNRDRRKVLLVYHNIYNSWSWLGGHADGETDLLAVALRGHVQQALFIDGRQLHGLLVGLSGIQGGVFVSCGLLRGGLCGGFLIGGGAVLSRRFRLCFGFAFFGGGFLGCFRRFRRFGGGICCFFNRFRFALPCRFGGGILGSGRSDGFFRRRGLRRGRCFRLRGCLGGSIRCGLGRDVVVFLAHLYSSQNPLGVAPSWKNRRQPGPGCTQ